MSYPWENTDGRAEIDLSVEPAFRLQPRSDRCEHCFGVGTDYVRAWGGFLCIACPACGGSGSRQNDKG